MSCAVQPNTTVAGDLQYWRWNYSLSRVADCGNTYIRPNTGGSLQPWLIVVFQIIIHAPTVVVRMARWQRVQILSLAIAAVMLAVYIQAFVSTKLQPERVLVWTPLTLILDAGSLLQILVLIIEDISFATCVRTVGFMLGTPWRLAQRKWNARKPTAPATESAGADLMVAIERDCLVHQAVREYDLPLAAPLDGSPIKEDGSCDVHERATLDPEANAERENTEHLSGHPYGRTVVALLALILLLMVVTVQIIAIRAAARGQKVAGVQATWCCPMFAPLVVAVLDGNCNMHPVVARQIWGNGCITLQGVQQREWLRGTVVLVSLSLLFQAFDFAVLTLVNTDERWAGVKMRRPWLTMFAGILVLIIITAYGTFYASTLPQGVTEMVWVFHWDKAGDFTQVCTAKLASAGLRGAFISWFDGLFDSWGATYYGF